MLKITLQSPGEFKFKDVAVPAIREGEALIEVKSMGICAGDIYPYMGKKLDISPLPAVQCHEFGGIVVQVKDSSDKIKVGDKVAVSPHINCGGCFYCNRGLELTCDNDKIYGFNIDGGFAEKVAVPVSNLMKLSSNFDIKYAAVIEPATVAYNIIKNVRDSIVMIVGTGSIGIMAVPMAKYFNNKVIAVDIDENHLNIAKKLGADLALNFEDKDKDKKIEEKFGAERIDYVGMTHVDQQLLDWTIDAVRRCSTVTFIDIVEKPIFEINFRKLWSKIITLKGLDSFYFNDFEFTANLIEKEVISLKDVVSKLFPMSEIKKAYDYKIKNNALKVILTN